MGEQIAGRRLWPMMADKGFNLTKDHGGAYSPEKRAAKPRLRQKVSAHILRHTMATTLVFNGCTIGHIQDLLGHERLGTTCRYCLAVDIRAAKATHQTFLRYD